MEARIDVRFVLGSTGRGNVPSGRPEAEGGGYFPRTNDALLAVETHVPASGRMSTRRDVEKQSATQGSGGRGPQAWFQATTSMALPARFTRMTMAVRSSES